jgi:predicted HTH transcriptional regulator
LRPCRKISDGKQRYKDAERTTLIVPIEAADSIRVNIAKLKTKGLIERISPDKGGYWKVV